MIPRGSNSNHIGPHTGTVLSVLMTITVLMLVNTIDGQKCMIREEILERYPQASICLPQLNRIVRRVEATNVALLQEVTKVRRVLRRRLERRRDAPWE